jgi:hypothetical protein
MACRHATENSAAFQPAMQFYVGWNTDLEVSTIHSIVPEKGQYICGGPRLAASQVVKREEELEAIVHARGCLECQILCASASRHRMRIDRGVLLTTCVEVVPSSGGAMFKAKASMPLLAASRMSDSQFAAVYAPLLPTWKH